MKVQTYPAISQNHRDDDKTDQMVANILTHQSREK
jgi:hypothetical protein